MTKTLDQHIETTPGVAGGKPRIAGHRITVADIFVGHELLGKSADEIATEYDRPWPTSMPPWLICCACTPPDSIGIVYASRARQLVTLFEA